MNVDVLAERLDALGRSVEGLEQDSKTGFASLHRRLDTLNFVNPETFAMQLQLDQAHRDDIARQIGDIRTEIASIRDNGRWLWRTVVGALLTAAVVGLLVLAGLPS